MSDLATNETEQQKGEAALSRPYARAAFEMARKSKDFQSWTDKLALMAAVSQDPVMLKILDDPQLTHQQTADVFIKACGDDIDTAARNLLAVLAENSRLSELPMISSLYNDYRYEAEGTVEVSVVSALPLSDSQKEAITEALKKRFGQDVQLNCSVDEDLVGGAVIKAGDLVIDGSAAEHLRQLSSALVH
ncbi:MAG: F0F1 ATP synthase subunit delta [Gammaproteobacteria bacterium]